MKRAIAVVCALTLTGCNQTPNQEASAKIAILEAKVSSIEKQLTALQETAKKQSSVNANTGEWILWHRIQTFGPGLVGYAQPQVVSAFGNHAECIIAVSQMMPEHGMKTADNPITIEMQNRTEYFYCLPKGVQAGLQK